MADEPQGKFVGVVDEYGSVWSGEPGESELIGDLTIRADGETSALYLGSVGRSPESYEREIRSLESRLSEECANSYRLAQELAAARAES